MYKVRYLKKNDDGTHSIWEEHGLLSCQVYEEGKEIFNTDQKVEAKSDSDDLMRLPGGSAKKLKKLSAKAMTAGNVSEAVKLYGDAWEKEKRG